MVLRVPRYTHFWKTTAQVAGDALVAALNHPEVGRCWADSIEAVGRFIDGSCTEAELNASLDRFETTVRTHGQAITELYGPYLRRFLDSLVAHECFTLRGETDRAQQVADVFMPTRIWRLRPDNPIELAPDGSARRIEEAEREHVLQLHSYFQSLGPAGRIGRPQGSKAKGPVQTRLDPELASRALELHEAGIQWPQIARDLLGENPYLDDKERDRQRHKVARLIERGRLDRAARDRGDGKN